MIRFEMTEGRSCWIKPEFVKVVTPQPGEGGSIIWLDDQISSTIAVMAMPDEVHELLEKALQCADKPVK